jgi:hypothetical protein
MFGSMRTVDSRWTPGDDRDMNRPRWENKFLAQAHEADWRAVHATAWEKAVGRLRFRATLALKKVKGLFFYSVFTVFENASN